MRQEIRQLIEDGEEDLDRWLSHRSAGAADLWDPPQGPVLVLLDLLRRLDYPDMAGVTDDLTNGFDMVGKVRPGPGWRKRTDGRYNDIQEVCRRNRQYVQNRLQRPTPSKYAEQLLEELLDEQQLGRVVGPLRAPSDWPCQTVALPHIAAATCCSTHHPTSS